MDVPHSATKRATALIVRIVRPEPLARTVAGHMMGVVFVLGELARTTQNGLIGQWPTSACLGCSMSPFLRLIAA